MTENRIGDRTVYTGSFTPGLKGTDDRRAVREQRIEDSLMSPVAAPGAGQVQDLSRFYNRTLASVDQLRYPFSFPDLDKKAATEPSTETVENSAGATENSISTSATGYVAPQYYAIAGQMGRSIDSAGREVPLTREQLSILGASLSKFDLGTLQNLQQEGLKFRLYDTENPPAGGYPGGSSQWESSTLGTYRGNEKLISLRQKDFRNGLTGDVQDVVHHETGHAIDDMLFPDGQNGREMATEHDPYMKKLYDNYMARTEGSSAYQWSKYARTNVKEYFADGVEFYLSNPEKRESLRQKDPELYSQVENMLYKASGGRSTPARTWNMTPYPINPPPVRNETPYYPHYPVTMNNGSYWGPRINASQWPDGRLQAMAQYMMLCRLQWMMAIMMNQSMGMHRF